MINNNKDIRHSAAGSHWTKQNHKYIRKEGNRYIYPSDLKKISQQHANRQNAKNGKLINPTATYRDENGNVALRLHTKGAYASPNQADYKQYSKELSNQAKQKKAAGSPNEYVRNQEHAKKMTNIMRSPAINPVKYKDGIGPSPDSMHRRKNAMKKQGAGTDYKTLSTKYNQEQNRKKAANGGPSKHGVLYYNKSNNSLDKDYYTSDQEWAKDRTSKGSGRSIRTKEQLNQKKRSKALNSQGSVNRQQEAKDFKEYQDWEKADQKKRDSEPKRKAALNKQGSKSYKYESELYGIRDKDNLSGVRDQVSQQDAKEMSKIHRNTSFQKNLRESNKENNNKMYKLKNRVTKAISNLKKKKKQTK